MLELKAFKTLIVNHCGLEFNVEREQALHSRVLQRMKITGYVQNRDYYDQLCRDDQELAELINLLTVNETYFYRESGHFEVLMSLLDHPDWATRQKAPLRILCAGCSTGEEPFSLAMALHCRYGDKFLQKVEIVGIDIDTQVLEKARCGVYSGMSFRSLDPQLKERYFEAANHGSFVIRPIIKNAVKFIRCNLVEDHIPGSSSPYHAIFYRNVSIYFPPDVQKQVFGKLTEALLDDGALFLGSSETLYHNLGLLTLVEQQGRFYFRKRLVAEVKERRELKKPNNRESVAIKTMGPALADGTKRSTTVPNRTSEAPMRQQRPSFDQALQATQGKELGRALEIINQVLEDDPGFVKGQALKACILLNLQNYDEARKSCLRMLDSDPLLLEANLLLAMIANAEFDWKKKAEYLRKAIYIDSGCWLAHFYLGELYQIEGKAQKACNSFRRVIEILKDGSVSQHGLIYFPLAFKAEHFVTLCQHNIMQLAQS